MQSNLVGFAGVGMTKGPLVRKKIPCGSDAGPILRESALFLDLLRSKELQYFKIFDPPIFQIAPKLYIAAIRAQEQRTVQFAPIFNH